ncbi:MAG: tRNA (adenosine(37)-N6)-dimethylallyltransferase MiaA [Planctomycetaceae bacterium]|nr:tRNA (adenosine(37)-N6)-dimethylallyltransferase MiaA [Planctomycetaceae bacterium]
MVLELGVTGELASFQERLHRAIYLTGPTASGKSAIGVALAQRLDAEIIALDSMTLYRGMDIGTAKPTAQEQGGVPHHLIDVLDPWQSASVAEYRRWAIEAAGQIANRGRRVLFVGGTALYLKALLRGLFEGPGADPVLRGRLEREAAEQGPKALFERLSVLDPATAKRLHPNDQRRIIRALEVIEISGQPLSRLQAEHDQPAPAATLVFALQRSRGNLYERIHRRVGAMFAAGLVDEVRELWSRDRPPSEVAAQAVGYREVIAMLHGGARLDETMNLVQTRTRQFAKRQGTWFRGLAEVRPWPVRRDESPEMIAEALARECGSGTGPS